ncbi:hypothetical protein SPRG_06946 [Saprolegnia parasitica CBS 223.65]|uniref:AAA+ ATPase domain-containing protein n=1 Tax=Saprolegnia parasitica (strain CBS 223.65) TaxID=695850 RepID=A0A067CA40_SAPPC|nr:hypothetical protein SPRG_06946 [Saprolegnia parasitica CBS 223.65]KDO27358.1 hypothetical protein SPRG_06946 [Saprolegnia parasitica CBS 223.65]|eukprot:XP_012201801.1 hypothetical protein SPRG_06946 [Saprolegnia parasitica CBS 223.65]
MDRPTRLPLLTPDTASAINRSKTPLRRPRSLLHTPPPTPAELASVWSFLSAWVQRIVEGDQSAASIPGFGIVFIHVHGHSIRIPHFATHGPFATRHGLKFEDVSALVPLHRVVSLAFRDIAAHCHVDEYTAKSWLEHLVQNVGERMRSSPLVELGLGIGTVTCKQRAIDGHMAQKQQGTMDPDIRPVEPATKRPQPPRSLLAPSQALFHVLPSPEKTITSTPLKPTAPGSPRADQLSGLSRRARALAQAIAPLSPRVSLQKRCADAMPWQLEVKNQDVVLDCPELDAKYPPLLDPFCRTLGVEQVDAIEKFASSDRIGSNYSLPAAHLVIRKHLPTPTASPLVFLNTPNEPDAMVGLPALDIAFHPVAASPPKIELPLVTTSGKPVFSPLPATLPVATRLVTTAPSMAENDGAAARYQYYLEHVISTKDIVPMNPRWTEHIQKLVARALQQLPQARAAAILRAMFDETVANYYFSIKKAVLDYLLLREGTQRRLHIPGGTPAMYQVQMKWKWGEGYAHAIAPTRGWIDRKLLAKDHLSQYLMVLDSHLLALHYVWGDFEKLLLVDLPSTDELASHLVPMDIKTFEKRQLTQAAHVKRLLLDKWFNTAKRILTTAKNEDVLASALLQPKHYFDCVATLMSLQLRGLVVRSIDAYVAFFRKHASSSPLRGLLLSLQLDHTAINFATSLEDATAALLNVLFNIPACFTHVDRVETKFEPSIILGGSPFLWGVGLHEDEVVRAADEIKALLSLSMAHASSVRANYARYAMVAAGDVALEAFMAARHDIAAYAAEIGKFMRFAMQIAAEPNQGQCPSGLFHVDCTSLNAGLIQKASRFIQALFHAFSQATIQINMDIRQQFKLMVSRLSKKPVDLYELVDAEAYLTKLRSQELLELFRSVQDVKHRIQFLIEQVELVPSCPVLSGLSVASELLSSTAKTFEWKNQIEKVIRDGEVALQNERMRIETTFIAKRSRFQAELEELESEVNSFQKKSDLRHATTYVGQLTKVRDAILQARHTIDTIADEEAKLGRSNPTTSSGAPPALLKLRDVTELLSETGKAWASIEPLFASKADVPVLDKASPEAKKFALADSHWRSIMAAVVARPLCLAVIQIDKAADRLRECQALLENVLEGLHMCLELKRTLFPRFFFLSDAELIRALSTHPDALTTRKRSYLSCCFPGIGRLELNGAKEITNVSSSLDESIALSQVVPTEKVATDSWLARLEQGLYTSMQRLQQKDFRKWYLLWPEQTVLVIERYMFTNKIESALREPSSSADARSLRPHKLQDYLSTELEPRLADLTQELREGTHTLLHRINLVTNLIAQLLHARDCTADLIAHEAHLANADAFVWQSQLRVAWNDGNVLLKVLKSSVLYGNEYLGSATTWIVTPNTLKVARVVCSAMAMAKGSAVVGASSIGKATTLHMLASACGKLCMAFECVAHMDAFTRIIKGAAATGTWLLLRNAHNVFNHASIGVLTDLLHRVQEATSLREASVMLHGTKLRLRRGVHIAATFTASQLPRTHDAFLSLFRPVTLIAPDVEMVCRILCDLAGFGNPEMLGKQVAFALATAAKLFPLAATYMQSLRVVKNVVDRAKKLVLKEHAYDAASPAELVSIEGAMLLHVLGDVLSSVIPPSDATASTLQSFLETLASTPLLHKSQDLPHDVMTLALQAHHVMATPSFLLKLQQLYTALGRPQGVVLLGPTMSGKTTLYQTLGHALRLVDERLNPYAHHQNRRSGSADCVAMYQVVSPRSLSIDELYGRLLPNKTFDEGVLTLLLRRLHARSKLEAHGRFWLVMDGALSPSWTDGLHSLLEQDGYLSLLSGERLALPPQTRLLFESTSLVHASPGVVTRTAIVHVAASDLSWQQLYDSWWAKQDDALKELTDVKDAMDSVLDLIDPCLQFATLHFRASSFGPSSLGRMQSFLAILGASVRAAWPKMASMTVKQLFSVGHCAFLLGLVWGIGHTSAHDERVKFDNFLRALAGEPTATTVAATSPTPVPRGKRFQLFFPSNRPELVYAFGLSVDWGLKWELWTDIVPPRLLSVPMPLRSIKELFIPTANSTAVLHYTELFVQTAQHVLLMGPPSTGKSAVVDALCTQSLLRQRDERVLTTKASVFALVPCGVRTSPSSLLSSLQDHLERSRKNELSAPPHKTCVLILDDVSLPSDQDGTLAFLRHLLSNGAMYEPHTHAETLVSGIVFVGSVTEQPSRRRLASSERFVTRLVPLAFPELQASDMNKLLLDVGSWCVSSRNLSVDFAQMLPTLVKATMRLFISCNERFRVSPTRPHYLFRLDDMLQLTQAVARDCAATQFSDKTPLVRLWCHEATRTLADRLMSATDLALFSALLRDICTSSFAIAHETLFPNAVAAAAAANTVLRRASDDMQATTHRSSMLGAQQVTPVAAYLHANFLRITFVTLLPSTAYDEIDASDMVELLSATVAAELSKLTETLARPNAINNDVQLQLPFFIEHVVRLARVLRPPAGPAASYHSQHVLVWGPPGTGKATLSRLAAGIAGSAATYLNVQNPLFAVHKTWQRAINEALLRAAAHPTASVLVIKHALACHTPEDETTRDEYLVDMAELVCERYVPHFVTSSDLEALAPALRALAKSDNIFLDTQSSVEAYFAETLRRKLTFALVLTMPAHAPMTWQRHLQASYAHLFRHCHIHHVSTWPKDVLRAMVHTTCTDAGMADAELYLDAAEALFASAKAYETNACPLVPSRFVLHIASFARLWQSRVLANEERKAKLVAALDALRYLERLSTRVAQTVKGLTPEISRMSQVSQGINVGLETASQTLLSLQAQLSAEDDVRVAAVAKLESLQAAANCTLDAATTSVLDATRKLEGLNTQDMAELCSVHPMPPTLRYLLECMCRLLRLEPIETFDERDIETKLLDYTLPARHWRRARRHAEFTPACLAKLHPSGGPICAWARAIIQYKMTHVMLEPQYAHIKDAQVIVDGCEIKCAQLRRVVDAHVATMQATTTSRATTDTQVRELTTQLSDSTESSEKAQSLLSALVVFVSAWHQRRDECIEWGARLPAHALMATGLASYAGHVPAYGRHHLLVRWITLLSNLGLPSSLGLLTQTSHYATYDLLVESALLQRWVAKTVPMDDPISHENVAFLASAETYPLLIDPHEIAYAWVLAMTTDVYANETPYLVPPHNGSPEEFDKVQDDVFAAMQAGRPVLVRHTNLSTKSLLLPFLLAKRQASRLGNARPNFLTHKQSLLDFPTDWSLYLFTTDEAAPWLPAFATLTTPVYIELTPQIASDLFRSQVLGNASKHTLLHWQELKTSLHAAEHDASGWEDLCLSALAKAGDAILDDTAALLTWRHSYSDAVAKQVQLSYELSKATRLSVPLDVVRQRFVDLCLISDDLRHKSPRYGVSIAWLTHLLTSVLSAIGKSDAMAFLERITLTVYRTLHWGVCADDRTLLNLLFALRGMDGGDDDDVGRELDDMEERAKPSWAWCWSSQEEFRFLIAPQPAPRVETLPLRSPSWLPTSRWELLTSFGDILPKPLRRRLLASWMDDNLKVVWKSFYEAPKPWLMELPVPLSPLQRLCIVRALRPDQFGAEALAFVHSVVPSEWLAAAYSWSLGEMAAAASCATPLILSSQGHDALAAIKAAGTSAKVDVVLAAHSEPLERVLVATMKTGQWLVLRQVDTNPDWLETLHRAYHGLDIADVHWEFRLWLCVDATDRVPLSLAQRSVTRHMALGATFREHLFSCAYQLHAPLSSSVAPDIDATEALGSPTLASPEWLSLCFLHALLVARTQFGVHGFKGALCVTPRDFAIVVAHPSLDLESLVYGCNLYSSWDTAYVRLLLERYSSGQLKARLQRIIFAWTSPVERTASVRNLLRRRSSSAATSDMEGLLESVEAPNAGPLVPNNITSLPIIDNPVWFGLHASLVHDLYAALSIATRLESTYRYWLWRQFPPAIAAAAPPSQTRVEVLQYASLDKALDAASLDLDVAQKVFPLATTAPLHAILHAEVEILATIRDRLRTDVRRLQEALVDGAGVLPPALEPLHATVLRNEAPASWQHVANSGQTTWTGFQAHLMRQIQFFDDWVASGVVPDVHWLGAYLEPTRFLSAWSLHFAKSLNQPLHTIALEATIVSTVDRSAGGVYVDGVVLVGASWLPDATGVHTLQAPTPESATTGPLLLHFTPRTVPALNGLDGAASTVPLPLLRTVLSDAATAGVTEVVHLVYLPSTLSAADVLDRGVHLAIRDA